MPRRRGSRIRGIALTKRAFIRPIVSISTAALAAVQDLNKSCTECHKVYRTTDDGHYIVKPGSIPGY